MGVALVEETEGLASVSHDSRSDQPEQTTAWFPLSPI